MYLHLGGDMVVKTSDVVAILNLENISTSQSSREYLKSLENRSGIGSFDPEETKSIVLTRENVFASPISSLTLMKRASTLID